MRVRAQRGFTLIEVLIALLVLSIGLLGLAGLQVAGLQLNDSAYLRSQAQIITYDVIDRIRADAGNLTEYDTGGDFVDGSEGTPAKLTEWASDQLSKLPSGESRIKCAGADRMCVVDVRWDDSRADGDTDQTFTTRTRI